jgi:hypothetical protein
MVVTDAYNACVSDNAQGRAYALRDHSIRHRR